MTMQKKGTMGALLLVLTMLGCEAVEKNQVLAPPIPGSEPVDVFIQNLSTSEATLRLELPSGVRALTDVPARGTEFLSLDDAELLGGAVVRVLTDHGASDWFWVFSGSEVEIFLDQRGDVTASTINEETDNHHLPA